MSNIFSSFYRRLCERRERISAAQRDAETLRLLAENNPTCRIMTTALNDVALGKYVAILGGAILEGVYISDFSYISTNSIISNVDIGKFCSISSNVQIGLGPHPSRVFVSTYPAFYSNDNLGCPVIFRDDKVFDDAVPKTILGNDVWIGANVIIPGGIHIGTGAIVAAGAVVVKDVPPYAIVGGNPAKIIRYRFSEEQIKFLLESEWWDWSIEKIRQQVNEFSDIEKFPGSTSIKSPFQSS
jgi:acetyltransferase-like isoleucine patch superfamily enzyme